MTRGKPSILSMKPGSEARAKRKMKAESAFRAGELPKGPPAELRGMPEAQRAWRLLMRAHDQLPGEIYNGLDRGFLVGYCLSVQARQRAQNLERDLSNLYDRDLAALEDVLKARAELRMAIRLVMDLEKQLYATPKSRGGVSPAAREETTEEIVERELEQLNWLEEGQG